MEDPPREVSCSNPPMSNFRRPAPATQQKTHGYTKKLIYVVNTSKLMMWHIKCHNNSSKWHHISKWTKIKGIDLTKFKKPSFLFVLTSLPPFFWAPNPLLFPETDLEGGKGALAPLPCNIKYYISHICKNNCWKCW
jgi:hypothetical protein